MYAFFSRKIHVHAARKHAAQDRVRDLVRLAVFDGLGDAGANETNLRLCAGVVGDDQSRFGRRLRGGPPELFALRIAPFAFQRTERRLELWKDGRRLDIADDDERRVLGNEHAIVEADEMRARQLLRVGLFAREGVAVGMRRARRRRGELHPLCDRARIALRRLKRADPARAQAVDLRVREGWIQRQVGEDFERGIEALDEERSRGGRTNPNRTR